VEKNTFDASFEETFDFEVADAARGAGDLCVTLLDWDRLTPPDTVA
jgi:hypothetical protein